MKIFFSFARQAFHNTAIYRFDFWLRLVNSLIWMYGAYWLWTVLYTQQAGAFNVSLGQMVTYATLSSVIMTILRPANGIYYTIAQKVKSGEIVMDLLKPLDFHLHTLARCLGEMLFMAVTLALPMALIAHFFLGMRLPDSPLTALAFLVSVALGFGVQFSLGFLLGLLSVFTIDIRNIGWAYNAIVRFFSGSEIPLWLFPLFLSRIADMLPFKCVFAIPLSIYIGKFSPGELTASLGLQIAWLVGLALAGRLLWLRAHNHLTVQGG